MRLTRLATPPGSRDSASVGANRLRGGPTRDRRLPFDTGVSRAVVSPGTNGSVVRVSRRVASAAIGGTVPRGTAALSEIGERPILGPWARPLGPSRPPPHLPERRRAAGRYASAATISRALSLSLQSPFRPSLAVRLVRYRNRGVISLGRISPADFGLRYKAGLLGSRTAFPRNLPLATRL
jgi:hypothetical protein